jgi:hypothetical protein
MAGGNWTNCAGRAPRAGGNRSNSVGREEVNAKRRSALGALLGVATLPLTVAAQTPKRRVAWLGAGRLDTPSPFLGAFRTSRSSVTTQG